MGVTRGTSENAGPVNRRSSPLSGLPWGNSVSCWGNNVHPRHDQTTLALTAVGAGRARVCRRLNYADCRMVWGLSRFRSGGPSQWHCIPRSSGYMSLNFRSSCIRSLAAVPETAFASPLGYETEPFDLSGSEITPNRRVVTKGSGVIRTEGRYRRTGTDLEQLAVRSVCEGYPVRGEEVQAHARGVLRCKRRRY